MTKYKEYYKKMLSENKEAFERFRKAHDKYCIEQEQDQEEYNLEGKKIMAIIKDYEARLCSRSEGNGYATFTGNLTEKFWQEIRNEFSMIDYIGIISKKEPAFVLNKIKLKT
ncbi:MAG: hypothetical protein AAB656_02625 [Patescibacteria group bacterium]